jgi:DNA-binding NarL/FixJ family response regulator
VYSDAEQIYTDLGAVWNLRRADSRLRPYGIRRGVRDSRRRPATGWESLTPTEVRVARLVAAGQSNPSIADELFLSRRTVQTHVSHILTKLGAHSRVEIVRKVLGHSDAGRG